ncbi:DUF5079 family protein [Staphylococcus sp. ACRSN]|nr:DUF5079 family protein [Staphylococcus sp. ACRSN]
MFDFYLFIYFRVGIKGQVPSYMKTYIVISLILWLLLYLQEKGKLLRNYNNKSYKPKLISYFLVNLFSGYNIPFLISSTYVFYFSGSRDDAFVYWLVLAGLIIMSASGLFLFCCGEFSIFSEKNNAIEKLCGIILIVLSFIMLFYLSMTVSRESEENKIIWMAMIMLFCVHLLIGRSYFYLALFNMYAKDNGVDL